MFDALTDASSSPVPAPHPQPRGEVVGHSDPDLVDDFLNSCRARGLSPATIHRGYGHPLRRVFLPWCQENGIEKVSQITQRVIDRWTASLLDRGATGGRELSRFSVQSYARTVSQFLSWARREGEEVNAKPQLPRLPRVIIDVLSRKEIEEFVAGRRVRGPWAQGEAELHGDRLGVHPARGSLRSPQPRLLGAQVRRDLVSWPFGTFGTAALRRRVRHCSARGCSRDAGQCPGAWNRVGVGGESL